MSNRFLTKEFREAALSGSFVAFDVEPEEVFEVLSGHPDFANIRELELYFCKGASANLSPLLNLSSLETLSLVNLHILPDDATLSRLRFLKDLWLSCCSGFQNLNLLQAQSTSLEILSIHWCYDVKSLNGIQFLSRLRELQINTEVQNFNITAISELHTLKSLQILLPSDVNNFSSVGHISDLEFLNLSGSKGVSDWAYPGLVGAKS